MEKSTPAQRRSREPSTGSSPPAQPNKIRPSEGSWGTSTTTTEWIPNTGRSTRGALQRPLGRRAPPPPRVLMGSPCFTSTILVRMVLFNLSVAGINILSIWKNSVIIPILKAGKPREQGRSYHPISLLCPAVKIRERLILPAIVEALGTCLSQHGFNLRDSTDSALLPISARVVSGFNQRKPPSRTITITVDILKAFSNVSHRLLIEMIYRSWLPQSGQMACGVPPRQEGVVPISAALLAIPPSVGGGPTGIHHLPSPLQPLCVRLPIPDLDMTSYSDKFTLLASAPSIVEAEARANCAPFWFCGLMVSIWPLAPWNPAWPCSHPIPTSPDCHPQVQIGNAVALLNRTIKILDVTLDIHFTFGPHARDCVEQASRALNVTKALAGASGSKIWWPRIRPSCAPSLTAPLQVAQFLAGLHPFSDLPPLQVDFDSFPS